jgi:lysophospholipase L1-like esterase
MCSGCQADDHLVWYVLSDLTDTGANDAVLPFTKQHVTRDRFKHNLAHMINMIRDPASPYHSPSTHIILINAPPILEATRQAAMIAKWKLFGCHGPSPKLNVAKDRTKSYAEASKEVATEQNVPVVDLWTALVQAAGSDNEDALLPFFTYASI